MNDSATRSAVPLGASPKENEASDLDYLTIKLEIAIAEVTGDFLGELRRASAEQTETSRPTQKVS